MIQWIALLKIVCFNTRFQCKNISLELHRKHREAQNNRKKEITYDSILSLTVDVWQCTVVAQMLNWLQNSFYKKKEEVLANKDPHGSYKTYIFVMIAFYPLAILADSADGNGEHSVEISAINVHILNDF